MCARKKAANAVVATMPACLLKRSWTSTKSQTETDAEAMNGDHNASLMHTSDSRCCEGGNLKRYIAHSCTNNSKSFYFLPGEGLSVIEPILIDKLAKKLDWGLGTPNLLQRHVDIVNKDKKLGVASYSPNPLSLFLKLSLNFGLCALAIGLGRKVELY